MSNIVPRDKMVKTAGKAVGGIAGGITLLALNSVTGFVPALIIGGIFTVGGASIAASSPEDRNAGLIGIAVGAATIASSLPLIGGLASTLLSLSGIGLLGTGVYCAYKFWQGLNSRR
ncbi:hypothetical protein [Spirochaeta dissipatitropha]